LLPLGAGLAVYIDQDFYHNMAEVINWTI